MALGKAGLASHERPNGGGRGVELVDLELLADLPEAGGRRVCGHPLEHDRGRPIEQRAVNDVAVSGDPADVGGAPIDVAGLVLEHVGEAVSGIHHVTTASVDHPLRLARAARGVEDEQQVLGVHGLGWTVARNGGQGLVEPNVAVGGPLDVFAGVADHQVGGDRGAFGEGLVHDGFEGEPFGATLHAVAGDHANGACVLDAVCEAARREAGKDDAVYRTDAGAGEHSNGQFRYHWQVKRHAVALLYPARLEHIGKAADPVVQLRVGDGHGVVCRVIGLPQNGRPVTVIGQVPVQTVGGDVELCPFKPAHRGRFELCRAHLFPRLHPCVMRSDVGPKSVGVLFSTAARGGNGFGGVEQKRHGDKLARPNGRAVFKSGFQSPYLTHTPSRACPPSASFGHSLHCSCSVGLVKLSTGVSTRGSAKTCSSPIPSGWEAKSSGGCRSKTTPETLPLSLFPARTRTF